MKKNVKEEGRKAVKLSGLLKLYVNWPIYVDILLLILSFVFLMLDYLCAAILFSVTVIYTIVIFILLRNSRKRIDNAFIRFGMDFNEALHDQLKKFRIPYGIVYGNGAIKEVNDAFIDIFDIRNEGKDTIKKCNFKSLVPSFDEKFFMQDKEVFHKEITIKNRSYKVEFKRLNVSGFMNDENLSFKNSSTLLAFYMFDVTELNTYKKRIVDEQPVVGYVSIDNYDMLDDFDENPMLTGLVEQKINEYFGSEKGIVQRFERGKYLVAFRYKSLEKFDADKFSLMEDVRKLSDSNGITLSMGIATGYGSFNKDCEIARMSERDAMERGGDQVVFRDSERDRKTGGKDPKHYGGNSLSCVKQSRTEIRRLAEGLKKKIKASSNLIIMGHKNSDHDALGAAIAVYRIAKTLDRPANILINNISNSLAPVIELFKNNPEYEEDLFINDSNVEDYIFEDTLLVIVDVNSVRNVENTDIISLGNIKSSDEQEGESKENVSLIAKTKNTIKNALRSEALTGKKCKKVVLIDHHRKIGAISNADLSYIEPSASSACEILVEIMQFMGDIKLTQNELNVMYAGMLIDTKDFKDQVSQRTFEAAAYLMQNKVNIVEVRKLLMDDIKEYEARIETVKQMVVYRGCIAYSICQETNPDSQEVVGAQAANALIEIKGIKASIVFTDLNGNVKLSIRSMEQAIAQRVAEALGGGGHATSAGALFRDMSVEEAIERTKKIIDDMIDKGDL